MLFVLCNELGRVPCTIKYVLFTAIRFQGQNFNNLLEPSCFSCVNQNNEYRFYIHILYMYHVCYVHTVPPTLLIFLQKVTFDCDENF